MAFQTGQGAGVVFATTTTFTPNFTQIGGPGWTRDSLETTTLATTGARTMVGSDLWTIAPITCTFLIDGAEMATTDDNSIDDILFDASAMTASESAITVTLGNTEASTFAAAGHITEFQMEEISLDALAAASITFQWEDTPTITE